MITVARDARLAAKIKRLFQAQNARVAWESDISQLMSYFDSQRWDVVVLTSKASRKRIEKTIALIRQITQKSPATQILFLAEQRDVEFAMATLQAGTYQYAKLPVGDAELKLLIQSALAQQSNLDPEMSQHVEKSESRFDLIVGRSVPMQNIYHQIRLAAATNIPILLLGETGTGKDLVAQAIHKSSAVQRGPYIPVNLGALPADLVASELLGYEKGAFTGATVQYKGKFEQATDGTIFLDEIDSMDEKVQINLLRLIEQKKLHRIGGRRGTKINARIIAASNQDLDALIRNGSFREDLFYRLDVFRIEIPPLRERHGDIPLLIDELAARYIKKLKKSIRKIAPECISLLENHDWPGNIRELKNVIQRAVLVCDGTTLRPKHLPPRFHQAGPVKPHVMFEVGTPLDEIEKTMVMRALEVAGNNRKRAAELLGISRRAIYNKLHKHGIQ